MPRWRALVQDLGGVREVGMADTYEAALELARKQGLCAWAMRDDLDVPKVKPRKPSEGRTWRKCKTVAD